MKSKTQQHISLLPMNANQKRKTIYVRYESDLGSQWYDEHKMNKRTCSENQEKIWNQRAYTDEG